jgi:hypothetical protein
MRISIGIALFIIGMLLVIVGIFLLIPFIDANAIGTIESKIDDTIVELIKNKMKMLQFLILLH